MSEVEPPPQQGIPSWLREGLNSYFELATGQWGEFEPGDPDAPFGHLSGFVQHHSMSSDGEWVSPPYEEAVSEALYVPKEVKPEDSAMGEDNTFIIRGIFAIDTARYYTDPQFRLDVRTVRGHSRKSVVTAARQDGAATIYSRDMGSMASINGGIRGKATRAKVVKPAVTEKIDEDKKWGRLERPSEAVLSALQLLMAPELDPSIKRARLKSHMDPRYLRDMIRV